MVEFQWKKKRAVYKKLKQREATKEKFRSIAQACRDTVRKAAAQLELEPVRDVKGNKKSFQHCNSSKKLNSYNASTVLKGVGDLVTAVV